MTAKGDNTTSASNFKEKLQNWWGALLKHLREDKAGWIHLAVAAVVCLILSAALYVPLGLPAYGISRIALLIPDGSCATDSAASAFARWACGAGLAITLWFGALVVILVLFLLRRQLRAGAKKVVALLPEELQFLERPVVVLVAFTLAWAGVQFHFFTRWGFIIDGLFPAIIGLLMFALTFWETPIKKGLGPAWNIRERIPKLVRIILVIAVPVLLSFAFNGWMPFSLRDQLVALIAVFVGWFLWTSAPNGIPSAPKRPRATSVAVAILLTLAFLLAVAVPVAAAVTCKQYQSPATPAMFQACEAAHHNGTFGAAGAVAATGATAVVLAPGREEEEEAGEEATDVDPCMDQQNTFDQVNTQSEQNADALRLMDQLIEDRQAAYDRLSQSTLISQSVDLVAAAWSLGSRVAGVGAKTVAGKLGQIAAETITPAIIKEALNEAMVKGNKLEAIKTAMQVAGQMKDKSEVLAIQKALESSIMDQEAQRLVALGFEDGGYVFKKAMKEYAKTAESLAAPVADFAGLAGQGLGLLTMYWDYDNMDTFLQRIAHMRKRRVDLWEKSLYLGDQLAEAKHQLDSCRYRVTHGLEVG